ncbi:MAG: CPBP family intramembrane glutamic endopeptidase [Ilumatobacteraceae bacterium]|nr:MAG: CPBP family intramembrane metalloprotease [Actinomycetota bacterium]
MLSRVLPDEADRRGAVVLLTGAVCLWGAWFGQELAPESWSRLAELCWWAATQIVFFLVVPLTVAWFALRVSPRDLGWRLRGTSGHARAYVGLFAIAVPFVLLASSTTVFQDKYPLYEVYRGQTGIYDELVVWWAFYAAQFVAVETFFRGFLLHGLVPRLGPLAVVVPVVPYTMLHFVKPPAEALVAIVGGLVMGTLSYRTRTIWWGVGLHVAVAALMDVSSLAQKGLL